MGPQMSSVYRYIVFAPNKQPTVEEIDELNVCCQACKFRYAVGVNGADGGLALAFDAREFEAARSTKGELALLLERWEVRGSEIRPRLLFIKRPDALQPIPGGFMHQPVELRGEALLKRKQKDAHESFARASLKLHQTLEQHAWLRRFANAVPYVLMGIGAVVTIVAGTYAYQRLMASPAERRQETIERVASDAMEEDLTRRTESD